MRWGAISTPSRVQQHIDVHGGGAQPIDDIIAHAHSNYHHVAAALRFEIFMKFLSWLFSMVSLSL